MCGYPNGCALIPTLADIKMSPPHVIQNHRDEKISAFTDQGRSFGSQALLLPKLSDTIVWETNRIQATQYFQRSYLFTPNTSQFVRPRSQPCLSFMPALIAPHQSLYVRGGLPSNRLGLSATCCWLTATTLTGIESNCSARVSSQIPTKSARKSGRIELIEV